jgi:Tfp pilus assembly protein PilW
MNSLSPISSKIRFKRAFSLVEMLVYISVLTVVFLVIINTVLSFTSSYRTLAALRAADNAGMDSMERMTRDIRAAGTIVTAQSSFGTSAGILDIQATSNGVSTTSRYYIQNGIIDMDINGSFYGPLTNSDAVVTSLIFTELSTTTSQAIKIDLTVEGVSGSVIKTKQFHSTIVLRGS